MLLRLSILLSLSFILSCSCEKPEYQDVPCKADQLPIVMVHGALGSGDNFALQALRFSSNGFCSEKLYAFDWNSLGQDASELDLDIFIDNILNETGFSQVNLVGHSAGGGLSYTYCEDPTRASKIAHYAHLGSFVNPNPPGSNGEVKMINIWSPDDLIVPGGDISTATNVSIAGKDHFQIATSAETFSAMYDFFENETPQYLDVQEEERIILQGRMVDFGINTPQTNAFVKVYEIDPSTGSRINSTPVADLVSINGNWGPFEGEKDAYYEFEISREETIFRKIHYYFEPFIRSNRFVYLRSFPPATTGAGILLASVPSNDDQSVVAIFSSNQAVITGRDNLVVDNEELSIPEFTSAAQTSIAFFLFDDGDSQSSITAHLLFAGLPFLSGVDLFFPTIEDSTIPVEFNGRKINVPNWKSKTEGLSVVVLN